MTNKLDVRVLQAMHVIDTHRKVAGYYTPARLLLESLYGEKWRSIKAKLTKVTDPLNDKYYQIGVRELIKRADALNLN